MNNLDDVKRIYAQGDKEGAIKKLASVLRLNGNDVEAWLLLGKIIDEPAKKRDCYNQILKLSPNHPLALNGLRELEISQLRLDLSSPNELQEVQPKIQGKSTFKIASPDDPDPWAEFRNKSNAFSSNKSEQNKPSFKPSQSSALGERLRYSGNLSKYEATPPVKDIPAQSSKTSFGTYIVLGIVGLCILSLLGQCLGNSRNSTAPPAPSIATADPQKQAAIDAVQNQDTLLANNMHESIAVILVLLENEGHTQSIDGWYVSRADNYYSVQFYFYLDGNREYAEWWYHPDTKFVMPKNDWALAFMGE